MTRYLLDTNHLSHCLRVSSPLRQTVRLVHRQGSRFGVCAPVLCEMEAGLIARPHEKQARRFLKDLLDRELRIWPIEMTTVHEYGIIFHELRRRGRVLSQVDMMAAAICRDMNLILLSTDRDFDALPDLRHENWLESPPAS